MSIRGHKRAGPDIVSGLYGLGLIMACARNRVGIEGVAACYAIDALPHRLWESAGAEGGGVVSLMPWADLERVVAANY